VSFSTPFVVRAAFDIFLDNGHPMQAGGKFRNWTKLVEAIEVRQPGPEAGVAKPG